MLKPKEMHVCMTLFIYDQNVWSTVEAFGGLKCHMSKMKYAGYINGASLKYSYRALLARSKT